MTAPPIDLASRWSWWQTMAWPTPPDGMDHDETTAWLESEGIEQRPLTADELAHLTAWVSGWIVGWRRGAGVIGTHSTDRDEASLDLAWDLTISEDGEIRSDVAFAAALLDLGGWPKVPQPRRLTREDYARVHAEATGQVEDCDCGPGARYDEDRQVCRECGLPVLDEAPSDFHRPPRSPVSSACSPTEPGWWLYSGEPCHVVAHDGGLWAWRLDKRNQAKALVDVRDMKRSRWGGRFSAKPDIPRDYVVAREQLERLLDAIMGEGSARCLDPVGTVAEVDAALINLASRPDARKALARIESITRAVMSIADEIIIKGGLPGWADRLRAAVDEPTEDP